MHLPASAHHLQFRHPLPVVVTSAGLEVRQDEAYDWHGLRRGPEPFVIFQLTLGGSGLLTWEGVTRPVPPGTAMLLTVPHDHRYWLPTGGRWDLSYVTLAGPEAFAIWATIIAEQGPLLHLDLEGAVWRTAQEILRVLADPTASPYHLSELGYRLGMGLLTASDRRRSLSTGDSVVDRAVAEVRRRLTDELTVEDLARTAECSRFHLARRFRAVLGVAPAGFIAQERIRHAGALLRTGDLPVAQIARRCGFADPAYFGRVFRRLVGTSPAAYRARGQVG